MVFYFWGFIQYMAIKLSNRSIYIFLLVLAAAIMVFGFSNEIRRILIAVYMLFTVGTLYYMGFKTWVKLSLLLRDENPEFYQQNLAVKTCNTIKLINVPLFNFVQDILTTENEKAIILAKKIVALRKAVLLSIVLSKVMIVLTILDS